MYNVKPSFYDQFQCIADRCTDTCCAGWGVVVDEDSQARYETASGAIYEEIRQRMVAVEDEIQFQMEPDGRCPFLNGDNLCRMILAEGEGVLCQICTDHPRFYSEFGMYDTAGLGLCCEEASRLLLELDKPLELVETKDDRPGDDDFAAEMLHGLLEALLEVTFDQTVTVAERWEEILDMTRDIELQLVEDLPEQGLDLDGLGRLEQWKALLGVMGDMIPIDEAWSQYLVELKGKLPDLLEQEAEFLACNLDLALQYANIFAYLLYRHLPGAMWDGRLVSRVDFARCGLEFVHLSYLHHWAIHETLPMVAKINHLKNWSKQVEYCDENVELMLAL